MSSHVSKKNNKLIWIIIFFIVFILSASFLMNKKARSENQAGNQAVYAIPVGVKIDGTILSKPKPIKAFKLESKSYQSFTLNNLKGHWTLMFFGFSNCGYVCPTTLSALSKMTDQLITQLPAAKLPQVVMVSVDPERDTSARIQEYVNSYHAGYIGVRAPIKELKVLSDQMNVVFKKLASKDGNPKHYMINHSAEIMLIDPNANLRAFFSFPHTGAQMAKDYMSIVNSIGKRDAV